jgi:hypothetical protein
MTSPDGINWTFRTSAVNNSWFSVCYGNGLFVTVSADGTGNRVMTSSDGINWASRTSAADNSWVSVCYGNGLFAAVSNSGSPRVMTSGKALNYAPATNNIYNGTTIINGNVFLTIIKSGATQGAAGAAANEVWKTLGHSTLPDNVLMIGV